MDRAIPTEAHLAEMRRRGAHYLVGTPKGCLSRLEGELATRSWEHARPEVKVKLLPQEDELYVFVESDQQLLLAKLGWTLPPQARRRSPLQIQQDVEKGHSCPFSTCRVRHMSGLGFAKSSIYCARLDLRRDIHVPH